MNKLIQRQIRRFLGKNFEMTPEFEKLFNAISDSYNHYERDRILLERSLELSSHELGEANAQIRKEFEQQKLVFDKLRASLLEFHRIENMELASSETLADEDLLTVAEVLQKNIQHQKEIEKELLKAKEEAETANHAKNRFLANMSHELRTPLNAIIGYSEVLINEIETIDTKEILEDLKLIHYSGTNLLCLINEILDLSKLEAGKLEVFFEKILFENILVDIQSIAVPLAEKNKNQFSLQIEHHIGEIYTDVTKVRRILTNLINNSAKFTKEGSIQLIVSQTLEAENQWISCQVIDTGIGISEEQMTRIFDSFAQVDSSTTKKYEGSGLGLSLSRKYCELIDGRLEVESQLGQGSSFTLFFPVWRSLPKCCTLL